MHLVVIMRYNHNNVTDNYNRVAMLEMPAVSS